MRVCPVCRTPNLPTNPVCVKCNYQFFASRESKLRALDETALPQAPPGGAAAMPQPFAPVDFEEVDPGFRPPPLGPSMPQPAAAPLPPSSDPWDAPAPRPAAAASPPKKKAGRPKRTGFPRVPTEVPEAEQEALRYDAMKKSLYLVAVLIAIGVAVPITFSALGIHITFIGVTGIINYVLILVFFSYVRGVGRATEKPISGVERQALSRVRGGGGTLLVIPLLGSVLGQFGWYFQTSPMHPIYYLIAGLGILYTLSGVTSLKERYSYYAVFQFGFLFLLLQPLPGVLPPDIAGKIFGSVYWFETTVLFLATGFIVIAIALRKMRAGQYEALEEAVNAGQKALAARQYDKALPFFDRAVTIAHSLYSDKLFKSTRTGQRVLPSDYYAPWVGKATALALSGKGAKALTILDIILEVDNTNPDLWVNKGEVLLSLNRPAEAYIAFEAAQRLNPAHPSVMAAKTRALDRLRNRIE